MRSEVGHELDLLVVERTDLLAEETDDPDQVVVLDHRHAERGPNAGDLHGLDRPRMALDIRPRRRKIGYVSRAAGVQDFVERAAGRGTKHHTLGLRKCRRHVIGRVEAQPVSFEAIERGEFRLTNAGRFLEHGRKHRREVAGSSGDGLQHLRVRCLLLQRLPQLIQQPRIVDGDHGLRGELCRQFDFAVAERIDPATAEPDHDYGFAIAHQRHADHRAIALDLRLLLFS